MTRMSNNPRAPDQAPPADGRQSAAALDIARGVTRLMRRHAYTTLAEMPLPNGRRADLVGISEAGRIWIVEVKSCLADFRADAKWPDYLEFCDRFSFAVGPDFPPGILPADAGLVVADRYGGEIVRDAPESPLTAARRKALTLRYARIAAERLSILYDPDPGARIEAFRSA